MSTLNTATANTLQALAELYPKSFLAQLANWVTSQGPSDEMAYLILLEVVNGENDSAMVSLWLDTVENYPEGMFNVLRELVRMYALAYTDKNAPRAWFRLCFLADQAADH